MRVSVRDSERNSRQTLATKKGSVTHEEYLADQRRRAVEVASQILAGSIGLTEGIRNLVFFQKEMGGAKDPEFLFFAGIVSETDDFAIGDARKNWNEIALKQKDADLKEYEDRIRPTVLDASRRFVQKYGA
jgi:hypothetical protein